MLRVVRCEMVTDFCPTQWKGETDDGREVYARFRHNHGYVMVAKKPGEKALDGVSVIEWEGTSSNPFAGCLSYAGLRAVTEGMVEWPAPSGETDAPAYVRDGSNTERC